MEIRLAVIVILIAAEVATSFATYRAAFLPKGDIVPLSRRASNQSDDKKVCKLSSEMEISGRMVCIYTCPQNIKRRLESSERCDKSTSLSGK